MSRLHVESDEKTLALAEWVQGVIEGQVPATRKTPAARRAPRQRCLARRSGSRTQDGRCGARATGRTGRRGAQGGNRYVVTLGLILTAAGVSAVALVPLDGESGRHLTESIEL